MIVYDSKKNWVKDIGHLFKSYTMVKVVRGTFIIGALATAFCVLVLETDIAQEFDMSSAVFSLLGIVLSIMLVFRTNTAYDRWWEGRKQWGALVNNTRNLAAALNATLPKKDAGSRAWFAAHISNFCLAFVEHLREGTKIEELVHISEEEKALYATKKHIPNHIVYEIYNAMHVHYKQGDFSDSDMINLQPMWKSFLDILGACERIKKTPIPFSYAVYIKIFVTAFSVLLPFELVSNFGYWTIPMVMFVFFAFLGIELMAEEIESPFGLDCNDLPTGDIAKNIKNNVYELLEVRDPEMVTAGRELYEKVF